MAACSNAVDVHCIERGLASRMLATLAQLAQKENLPFRYGRLPEENIAADDQIEENWLYQEGYLNGNLKLADDNSVTITYTVNLWIMAPSRLADLPEDRGPELITLFQKIVRIYRKLGDYGTVFPANFIEGINLLNRNVDGIRLTFAFTPTLPFTVC